ncbi:hypothetical protein [Kurthia senegalensis]|nr:hypothetical protein [Kurthia senegalensis]
MDETYPHDKTLCVKEATLLKEPYIEHDGVVVGEKVFGEVNKNGR